MNDPNQVCCPKCGSNQITAQKKGFSGKKAVAGVVLTGGIGLLAGTIGSDKIKITCLNCGNQFNPGDNKRTINPTPKLIWDEKQQKHVINPKATSDTFTMPLSTALIIFFGCIITLILIIYLINKK
jgi:hypothetical protein